mmetsp:Transcript_58445/g.128239  ORF Transcript_58445/g.128239 Transcript_58445/m.128239 type:complete len:221 (+) Transcript_58445:319-981(+)
MLVGESMAGSAFSGVDNGGTASSGGGIGDTASPTPRSSHLLRPPELIFREIPASQTLPLSLPPSGKDEVAPALSLTKLPMENVLPPTTSQSDVPEEESPPQPWLSGLPWGLPPSVGKGSGPRAGSWGALVVTSLVEASMSASHSSLAPLKGEACCRGGCGAGDVCGGGTGSLLAPLRGGACCRGGAAMWVLLSLLGLCCLGLRIGCKARTETLGLAVLNP